MKIVSCSGDGADWLKAKKQWKASRYIPKARDNIFFDWEEDGVMDSVDIVEKFENETVYTIESNSGDVYRKLKYEVKNKAIFGYGVLIYGGQMEKNQNRY